MNRSRSGYVYIVLCAVIFSTMEVMLKTVHGVFAPMQITCLRFLVGGVLLIPFAMRSIRKKNAVLTRKDLGFFACEGFLCVVIAMSLYQMSVTYTRASIVAVIFSCNPIFVTMLAHFLLHEEIHKNHVIALILELTAALIIIDPVHASLDPTGALLAILSAAMFSFYSVFGKKRPPHAGPPHCRGRRGKSPAGYRAPGSACAEGPGRTHQWCRWGRAAAASAGGAGPCCRVRPGCGGAVPARCGPAARLRPRS